MMGRLRFFWLGGLLSLLAGCSIYTSAPPVPESHALSADRLGLPRQVFVTEIAAGAEVPLSFIIRPLWQVILQAEGDALRWSRFNVLGVPDARQILENGHWRNDGFIHPNREARELFAALLFAWMDAEALDAAYGAGRWLYRTGALPDATYTERELLNEGNALTPRWTVNWPRAEQKATFSIVRHSDGLRWEVRPLVLE